MDSKPKKAQEGNKWALFLGIPFQMLVVLLVGYFIGDFLDNKYQVEDRWWTIGMTLLALFVSLYQIIKQVKSFSDRSK